VNVYAETNFVPEMALRQEQWRDCEAIAELCRERRIASNFHAVFFPERNVPYCIFFLTLYVCYYN